MNTVPRRPSPPSALILLVVTVIAFFVQVSGLIDPTALALWPLGMGFAPWQLISYGFLHGGLMHLFLN
ncbi:MAG: hypothetical protein V2J10_05800, partial [Wenzhouxiangella sp.]|nr:hypothetical protein [Wenzhouxiangella sp.]